MAESSLRATRELSRSQFQAYFIRNPLEKTIPPRYLINYTLDKKRAKSLLRKVDKTYLLEEKVPEPQTGVEIIMSAQQVLLEKGAIFNFENSYCQKWNEKNAMIKKVESFYENNFI